MSKDKSGKPGVVREGKLVPLAPSTGASKQGWHSIVDFLRCPEEYRLRHLVGLKQPQEATPDPLGVGMLVHYGVAKWQEAGHPMWDEALDAKVGRWLEEARAAQRLPIRTQAEREARWYVMCYAKHWGMKAKPRMVGVEYELGPTSILPGRNEAFLARTARLDGVGYFPEANGALVIQEMKTTSVGVNDALQEYTLHGQPLLQALLWKLAPQGEAKHGPIAGVLLDVIHKRYDSNSDGMRIVPTHGRVLIPVPQYSLEWFAEVLALHLREASMVTAESKARRNPTACTRLVGRMRKPCEFRNLCQYGPGVLSQFVNRDGKTPSASVLT